MKHWTTINGYETAPVWDGTGHSKLSFPNRQKLVGDVGDGRRRFRTQDLLEHGNKEDTYLTKFLMKRFGKAPLKMMKNIAARTKNPELNVIIDPVWHVQWKLSAYMYLNNYFGLTQLPEINEEQWSVSVALYSWCCRKN